MVLSTEEWMKNRNIKQRKEKMSVTSIQYAMWHNKKIILDESTSSRLELVRCMPGPMITSLSGKTSTSLLYMSTGNVAVTKRYCVVTGEDLIKLCNTCSKPSSPKSISTSSNTALTTQSRKKCQLYMFTLEKWSYVDVHNHHLLKPIDYWPTFPPSK